MKCPKCGVENRPSARFCRQCGHALVPQSAPPPQMPQEVICPTCGTANRYGSIYCQRCGKPLGAWATPPPPPPDLEPTFPVPVASMEPAASPASPPASSGRRMWLWIAVAAGGLLVMLTCVGFVALAGGLDAVLARILGSATSTPTPEVVITDTPMVELPPDATITLTPLSETSTDTPVPVGPTQTLTPTPCLPDADFDTDVTIPDNTNLLPGEKFTKIWRMRSNGCAAWPEGTRWVFVSGDRMGAPESVAVPAPAVGSTVDISVEMQAPDSPGTYRSNWRLQGPDGTYFGDSAYVLIVVPAPTPTPTSWVTSIMFVADRYTINSGECVTLYWSVENVKAVLYMGDPATGEESRIECPTSTTTYILDIQHLDGAWETRTLEITVLSGY